MLRFHHIFTAAGFTGRIWIVPLGCQPTERGCPQPQHTRNRARRWNFNDFPLTNVLRLGTAALRPNGTRCARAELELCAPPSSGPRSGALFAESSIKRNKEDD